MLTVIITCRNDQKQLLNTIESIGMDIDQIVVDDGSTEPVKVPDHVELIRNRSSLGVGAARHQAAGMVKRDWLVFTDSHMRYPPDWSYNAIRHLARGDVTDIWCSTFHSDIVDPTWHDDHFVGGADFILFARRSAPDGLSDGYTFADIAPRYVSQNQLDYDKRFYEVPVVMGACYFVHKTWYEYMGGFDGLIGYGCDEQLISIKSWLMGGSVRVMPWLPVTHIWQGSKPRQVDLMSICRNKLVVLRSILSEHDFHNFCFNLPLRNNPDFTRMVCEITDDQRYRRIDDHRIFHYDQFANQFFYPTLQKTIESL